MDDDDRQPQRLDDNESDDDDDDRPVAKMRKLAAMKPKAKQATQATMTSLWGKAAAGAVAGPPLVPAVATLTPAEARNAKPALTMVRPLVMRGGVLVPTDPMLVLLSSNGNSAGGLGRNLALISLKRACESDLTGIITNIEVHSPELLAPARTLEPDPQRTSWIKLKAMALAMIHGFAANAKTLNPLLANLSQERVHQLSCSCTALMLRQQYGKDKTVTSEKVACMYRESEDERRKAAHVKLAVDKKAEHEQAVDEQQSLLSRKPENIGKSVDALRTEAENVVMEKGLSRQAKSTAGSIVRNDLAHDGGKFVIDFIKTTNESSDRLFAFDLQLREENAPGLVPRVREAIKLVLEPLEPLHTRFEELQVRVRSYGRDGGGGLGGRLGDDFEVMKNLMEKVPRLTDGECPARYATLAHLNEVTCELVNAGLAGAVYHAQSEDSDRQCAKYNKHAPTHKCSASGIDLTQYPEVFSNLVDTKAAALVREGLLLSHRGFPNIAKSIDNREIHAFQRCMLKNAFADLGIVTRDVTACQAGSSVLADAHDDLCRALLDRKSPIHLEAHSTNAKRCTCGTQEGQTKQQATHAELLLAMRMLSTKYAERQLSSSASAHDITPRLVIVLDLPSCSTCEKALPIVAKWFDAEVLVVAMDGMRWIVSVVANGSFKIISRGMHDELAAELRAVAASSGAASSGAASSGAASSSTASCSTASA